MEIIDTELKGKGLFIFSDETLLVYRKCGLYLYSKDYSFIKKISLPIQAWKRVLGKVRMFERLLHIEPRFAVNIDGKDVLLQLGNKMLCIDLMHEKIKEENVSFRGRPLSYAKIENIEGFSDSVIIGDYGSNENNESVNIYQRLYNGKWRIAYTFAPGIIWHIHGFVPDGEKNCVYILTGDEDDQSGIWIARNEFKEVEPILIGSQQYRTCQICVIGNKIYYFTDAPSEPNYLYSYNMDTKEVCCIEAIKGTCIYGEAVTEGIIASTTCEPEAHFDSNLYGMITRKPGKGIKGREVDLLYFSEETGLKTIKTFIHDGLPLKLFQYGTVVFSNYMNGKVLATPISVKNYDMGVFEIRGL